MPSMWKWMQRLRWIVGFLVPLQTWELPLGVCHVCIQLFLFTKMSVLYDQNINTNNVGWACVCMCVSSTCVKVSACASACLHVEGRCQSQVSSTCTIYPVFWDRVYHCHSSGKAGWTVSPMTLPLPPVCCDHKPVPSYSAWFWGVNLVLTQQALYPGTHLLSLVMWCSMES